MSNKRNIYVASSWRNTEQPAVVSMLRRHGHDVYDFRNPDGNPNGFSFQKVADAMKKEHEEAGRRPWDWDHLESEAEDLIRVLSHPMSRKGFATDMEALDAADTVVLVLPCERDAHLELGYAAGQGKQTHVLLDNPCKASLMYGMVDFLHEGLGSLMYVIGEA